MLNVKIGINKVSVTLSERVTLSLPYYLLRLTNVNNNSIKVLNSLDQTPFSRVNQMQFELTTNLIDEDLANSKIYLTAGTYKYEFFEALTDSLIITDNNLLETGLLLFDVDSNSTDYTTNNTEKVYGQ